MATVTDDRAAIDAERERLEAEAQGGDDDDAARNGNGRSVEDLAASGEGVEDEEGQQLLDFGDHLNLSIKGKKPTDSEIKIKAISRPIKGQLGDANDDEVVTLLVTARLDQIGIVAKRDGDGKVIGKTRRHTFTPVSVVPLTKDQADLALGQPED